jgi:hypothetical protein
VLSINLQGKKHKSRGLLLLTTLMSTPHLVRRRLKLEARMARRRSCEYTHTRCMAGGQGVITHDTIYISLVSIMFGMQRRQSGGHMAQSTHAAHAPAHDEEQMLLPRFYTAVLECRLC